MAKYILLASPPMQEMARAICEEAKSMELVEIQWGYFPDGFPNIFIPDIKKLRGKRVAFLACLDTPATIFEQYSVIRNIAQYNPKSFRIILPYFPTGTMERKDHEGQVATAYSLARLLSHLAPSGPGAVPLYIWDIHALQNEHYFGDNVTPRFESGTNLLKEQLAGRDVTIVYPDQGAHKRFNTMFRDKETGEDLFPSVICYKHRCGDKRDIFIVEGDPKGRDCVIVDDLIHSGATTIACKDVLLASGAESVSAYSTHGVMEKGAWAKFLEAGFKKVWITDSCPETAKAVEGKEPFEVLSIKEQIIQAIKDR